MRHHTTLPILLLALSTASAASAAQSLPYATVATVPASPAPGEPVVLKLTGQWPDGCVPEAGRTKLLTSGTKLQVNFNYSGFSGACTAAVTAWSLDVPVGRGRQSALQDAAHLVVDGVGQRDEDGGAAGAGDLRDRRGAGAGDDEVGGGVAHGIAPRVVQCQAEVGAAHGCAPVSTSKRRNES